MTSRSKSLRYAFPATVLSGALVLVSCGGPPAQEGTEQAAGGTLDRSLDTVHFQNGAALAQQDWILHPWVTKQLLNDTRDSFPNHFRVDEETPMAGQEVAIPWDTVSARAEAVRAALPDPDDQGVLLRFHYGLSSPQFQLGIGFMPMTRTSTAHTYAFDPDTLPVQHWNGGRMEEMSGPAAWGTQFQNVGTAGAYFNEMEVRPEEGGSWYNANPTQNSRSVDLPWELELLRLYEDNADALVDYDSLHLVVTSITAPLDGRFRHSLCVHLRLFREGEGIDLLEDGDVPYPEHPFYQRGADLGNLCPPSCPTYLVPIDLRP